MFVNPANYLQVKFSETKLIGIKSTISMMKNEQAVALAYQNHNANKINEQNVVDYLFPEIRAAHDLKSGRAALFDVRSLK